MYIMLTAVSLKEWIIVWIAALLLALLQGAALAIEIFPDLIEEKTGKKSHAELIGYKITAIVTDTVGLVLLCFFSSVPASLILLGLFVLSFLFAVCCPVMTFRCGLPLLKLLRYPFYPFSAAFISSEKRRKAEIPEKKASYLEEAAEALESTEETKEDDTEQEASILKGIVSFSKTETCEIMKPRMDIVALPISSSFDAVMDIVKESEYSRMPVYENDLDHIVGILYVKDLLPFLIKKESFDWKKLLRPAIFVPETRKIEILLKEFKKKRLHIAIVVDDYGSTSGIVTLEDIIEEVVGEIHDEFDDNEEAEKLYRKTAGNVYLFDGRMPIHDLCKLIDVDDNYFDIEDGDYESLAGLILEVVGYFPAIGTTIPFKDYVFTVEAIDAHRITQIKMERTDDEQ